MVELARKVLKNSFFSTSSSLIRGVGGFLFSVVLARILTPEQFGIYALAISTCFLILQLDPGTGYTATRYIAYAAGKKDEKLVRGYFRFLFKLRLIFGVLFAISLAIAAKPLAYQIFKKPEMFIPLEILSLFLFFFFLTDFIDCCSQAFQNFKYPAMRHAIHEFLKFSITIPLAFLFFNGIFIGITIASILTFTIIFLLFRSRYNVFGGKIKEIEAKRVLRFMGFVSIGGISGVVFSYVDMIMLGIFLPAEYAGYYKAATNIVFGIAGLTGIAGVLFPVFTQLESKSLEDAFRKVFRYASILSFPLAVIIAYFSTQIVGVIYGAKYLQASLPLLILSPIIVFNATNFFGILFGAKEKPEYGTAISIASMVMNVMLNYILILKFGMIGAAIATITSRFFNIAVLGILSSKILKISIGIDSIYKPLFASMVMLLFLYFFPHPTTLFIGILELCFAVAVYFAVLFLTGGIGGEDLRYAKMVVGADFSYFNKQR